MGPYFLDTQYMLVSPWNSFLFENSSQLCLFPGENSTLIKDHLFKKYILFFSRINVFDRIWFDFLFRQWYWIWNSYALHWATNWNIQLQVELPCTPLPLHISTGCPWRLVHFYIVSFYYWNWTKLLVHIVYSVLYLSVDLIINGIKESWETARENIYIFILSGNYPYVLDTTVSPKSVCPL